MLTRIQLLVASLNIFIQHEDEQSYQEQNQLAHGVTNYGPVVSHDIVVDEGTRQGKKPVYCKDKWVFSTTDLAGGWSLQWVFSSTNLAGGWSRNSWRDSAKTPWLWPGRRACYQKRRGEQILIASTVRTRKSHLNEIIC